MKLREGLCEWCEEDFGEKEYSMHEFKGIKHGYFFTYLQ